jgi:hypothetical protein
MTQERAAQSDSRGFSDSVGARDIVNRRCSNERDDRVLRRQLRTHHRLRDLERERRLPDATFADDLNPGRRTGEQLA